MKKIIAVVLAIIVVLSLGATCFADWNNYETLPDAYLLTTDYMYEEGIGPKFNADGTVTVWFDEDLPVTFSKEAVDIMYASYYMWWTSDDYMDTYVNSFWRGYEKVGYTHCSPYSTIQSLDVRYFAYRPFGALEMAYGVVEEINEYIDGELHKGHVDVIHFYSDNSVDAYEAFVFNMVNGVLEPIYLDKVYVD